jgi:glutamine synthetase
MEAISELTADTTLTDAMGPMLADSYLAIRRADWELFSQRDAEFEIRHHFYKY